MRILLLTVAMLATAALQAAQPDLRTLAKSGAIMGPGSGSYGIDKAWSDEVRLMAELSIFDREAKRAAEILCSAEQNRSVLIVGEPSTTFRYIFARLANNNLVEGCENLWHVDVHINKIEAGHRYVGDVDEYWNNNILKPSDRKDVVLYLKSLEHLIGIGSHSNDTTGIEKEYVSNFTSGRIRTVAFVNKYEYQHLIRSQNASVIYSFAEKIHLEPMPQENVDTLVTKYFETLYPNIVLPRNEAEYLYRTVNYYQPNINEPERTMTIVKDLVRSNNTGTTETMTKEELVETPHPYTENMNQEYAIEYPEAEHIQLLFSQFSTEARYDSLTIFDANTGTKLDEFSGNRGSFKTRFYTTNRLKLVFRSDGSSQGDGFIINRVNGQKFSKVILDRSLVRESIFKIVQVPRWLVDRDFTRIRELGPKLDGDVVGVEEGKRHVMRLARVGYVAGRTDEKPVGSALFVGPTGTGKSYIAKKTAEFMNMKLVTMDMTSYQHPSSFDRFLDIMANNLILNPFAIYLFEEIDKANVQILDRLFFMLDEGVFYDKYQRPLFARGSMLFMTTNASQNVIIEHQNSPDLRQRVNAALLDMFRPSFLNRFDAVTIFKPFSDEQFHQLAKIMVSKKIKKMRQFFSWNLSLDDEVMFYLGANGRSDLFGARPMERLIELVISDGIGMHQLAFGTLRQGAEIRITKSSSVEHGFSIAVDGRSGTLYEVNPEDINRGDKTVLRESKVEQYLRSIRMY